MTYQTVALQMQNCAQKLEGNQLRERRETHVGRHLVWIRKLTMAISEGLIFDHFRNSFLHCTTDMELVHRTIPPFRIVHAAVIPTKVLPAPHGSTIIPLLARPLPNIFDKAFSW